MQSYNGHFVSIGQKIAYLRRVKIARGGNSESAAAAAEYPFSAGPSNGVCGRGRGWPGERRGGGGVGEMRLTFPVYTTDPLCAHDAARDVKQEGNLLDWWDWVDRMTNREIGIRKRLEKMVMTQGSLVYRLIQIYRVEQKKWS